MNCTPCTIFRHSRYRHWGTCRIVQTVWKNHSGKTLCSAMQGIVAQSAPPKYYFWSEIRRVRLSVQRKCESPMEQDRGLYAGWSNLFHPKWQIWFCVSLAVWGFALSSKSKTPLLKSPGLLREGVLRNNELDKKTIIR